MGWLARVTLEGKINQGSHLILERSRAADGWSQGLVATAAHGMSRLQYRSGLHAPEKPFSCVHHRTQAHERIKLNFPHPSLRPRIFSQF